jgi:hypothetical protein
MKVGFGIAAAILALALTTLTPPAQACNGGGRRSKSQRGRCAAIVGDRDRQLSPRFAERRQSTP